MPRGVAKKAEVGGRYLVHWRNGQVEPATVIDRRAIRKNKKDSSANQPEEVDGFEYYVHYTNYDRRLDEWVTVDRIDLDSNGSVPEDVSPRTKPSYKKSKRKAEDMSGSVSQREDKLAILSNLEKEYEEITKVKNIQTIEMGKFEIGWLKCLQCKLLFSCFSQTHGISPHIQKTTAGLINCTYVNIV